MAYCYKCGDQIDFFHDGFKVIPVHRSGSCSLGSGYHTGASGLGYPYFRTTPDGLPFEFPFVTYPSYVNPNARCPVCGAEVYFYQSPFGGRVFFDELGPPWPKHPCTDTSLLRQYFSTPEGRAQILKPTNEPRAATVEHTAPTRTLPGWAAAGWRPFIVKTIKSRPIGIEAEGDLLLAETGEAVHLRILQDSMEATYHKVTDGVCFGYSLIQNANPILTALNESPILLKESPDLHKLLLSSFLLTKEGQVEEITVPVTGEIIKPA